jgi:hypothetical protein
MADIRNEDIITYFESRNNRFKNSMGMEFGKADGNMLLWQHEAGFLMTNTFLFTETDIAIY